MAMPECEEIMSIRVMLTDDHVLMREGIPYRVVGGRGRSASPV